MEKFYFIKSLYESLKDKAKINNKRGMSVGDIYPVMLTIALTAILIGIVLYFLASFTTMLPNGSAAQNGTNSIIAQISSFIPWIGIILLVIAAAIIIGILVRNLAGGSRV